VPAALAIAGMAVVLAVVLTEIGVLDGLDGKVRRWFSLAAGDRGLALLPQWPVWAALALGLFGLTWSMIESPGWWRRMVLWISAGAVVAGGTPVAALAGGWLPPAALVIGWLWSGIWAIVYGIRYEAELAQARGQRTRPGAADPA
jgi:hypothetical protein